MEKQCRKDEKREKQKMEELAIACQIYNSIAVKVKKVYDEKYN